MRALIRSNTGRPFRRAGREFPPQSIEVDLSDFAQADLDAILGEPRLVVQMLSADGDDQGGDDDAGEDHADDDQADDDQADQTQGPGGEQRQGSVEATAAAVAAALRTRRSRRS